MVRIDAAVMMTKPLIVASRAVSGCLRFPGVAWASRLRLSAPTRLSGASSRCPVGDPGGSEFHVACGPTWRVAIDRPKRMQKLRETRIVGQLNDAIDLRREETVAEP